VMTGEHDANSTPAMAKAMHERIRGSRLVILPRYRHSSSSRPGPRSSTSSARS
jgi:hypothetical protein